MALVMAGLSFTKESLKSTAGNIAMQIRERVQDGMDLKVQLESWPDADLITLGLTQEEINAIKGFYIGDLPAIATALSSSTWLKQLLGVGV